MYSCTHIRLATKKKTEKGWDGLWCLTSLSTEFQLYRGGDRIRYTVDNR